MNTICVIINPFAQGGKINGNSSDYLKHLTNNGINFDVYPTKSPRHSIELVEELINDYDVFMSIGGDGLVHEIIQVLSNKKNKTLAVAPAGNGNMFARHHKLNDFYDVIRAIKENRRIPIDLVKLNFKTESNESKTIYSHCIFGIGYIENVVTHGNYMFRKLGPKFCYPLSSIAASLKLYSFCTNVKIDKKSREFSHANTIICLNHGKVGPFDLAESVIDTDGLLDYVIYHDLSIAECFYCILDTVLGLFKFDSHRLAGKAKKIEFELDEPLYLMIDGESYEKIIHLKAEVIANALYTYSMKNIPQKS